MNTDRLTAEGIRAAVEAERERRAQLRREYFEAPSFVFPPSKRRAPERRPGITTGEAVAVTAGVLALTAAAAGVEMSVACALFIIAGAIAAKVGDR